MLHYQAHLCTYAKPKQAAIISTYCWWKKSCSTWHVWNPVNNGFFFHINWCRMSSINSISTSLSQQYIMILSKQRLQNDKSDRVQTAEGSMLQWVPYWLWKSMLTSREECQLQPVSLNYPGAIGICPKPWHAALATKYVSGKSTYMAWRMICSPQTPWNSPNNWWRISPLFPTI